MRSKDTKKYYGNYTLTILPKGMHLPIIKDLTSDPNNKSVLGFPVSWSAKAIDPDGNDIYYKYYMMGPLKYSCIWSPVSPDDVLKNDSNWVWDTKGYGPGLYEIGVKVYEKVNGSYNCGNEAFLSRSFELLLESSSRNNSPEMIISEINKTHPPDNLTTSNESVIPQPVKEISSGESDTQQIDNSSTSKLIVISQNGINETQKPKDD
jgi:hypothetical protein